MSFLKSIHENNLNMKKLNFATILLSMGMAVIVTLGTTNPTSSIISIPAKPVGA